MRLLSLADDLRAFGLRVEEVDGWRGRGGEPFDPVGVLIHHTAGPRGRDAPSLSVCINGRPGLKGPLCQILIARSGICHIVASARCNHAGTGGPLGGVTDGNRQLVGIEAENDGVGEPWPMRQQWAMENATAAVLHLLGQDATNVWAHKEWAPGRKIDPAGIDMARFRNHVAIAMADHKSKETTMPTPASDEMVRQWQQMLLSNGAKLGGGADGLFGRLTLEASKVVLDHRNQLMAANKTSADTIVRLTGEQDKARAELATVNQAAATAATKAERLQRELAAMEALAEQRQERIDQLLAELDAWKAETERLAKLVNVIRGQAMLAVVRDAREALADAEAKLQGLA